MASSPKPWLRVRPARGAAPGSGASVLRLAARGRLFGTAPQWLVGLARALRSAGPTQGGRPLHGVLAGGAFPRQG